MNLFLDYTLVIILWVVGIYFTIYCIKQYVDKTNAFWACFLHLFLIALTIICYPA